MDIYQGWNSCLKILLICLALFQMCIHLKRPVDRSVQVWSKLEFPAFTIYSSPPAAFATCDSNAALADST
jgi:hypothetical protein